MRAARSFGRSRSEVVGRAVGDADAATEGDCLRLGVFLDSHPAVLEVEQISRRPVRLQASTAPAAPARTVRQLAARVVNAGLDLRPFYRLVSGHPILGPLSTSLEGLKAFRPANLFEMLIIAVTEQQISLAAARHIMSRVIDRFGTTADGIPVFPPPDVLALASLEALTACGLSHRKAEYVSGIAALVVGGELDLSQLESIPDDEVRARLSAIRGLGRWSADYILIRGMTRPDVVPEDDLGIRTVVGRTLGNGPRMSAAEVADALAPLAPYRGVAVFYLLAATRLGLL
jgi:DNA-3-methyladenine glycosylase II